MNNYIIKRWDTNKPHLERFFRNTTQNNYDEYVDIVKAIINNVLNPQENEEVGYDIIKWSEDVHVIDDGDYQGTQLFVFHKDTYQPYSTDYIITNNSYGSCSGCDTLQSIYECGNGFPNNSQVEEYMTLALHLIQKMKFIYEK